MYTGQVPVTCYLRNSTEFQQFLEQNLQLQPDLVDQILSATVDPSQVGGAYKHSLLHVRALFVGGAVWWVGGIR